MLLTRVCYRSQCAAGNNPSEELSHWEHAEDYVCRSVMTLPGYWIPRCKLPSGVVFTPLGILSVLFVLILILWNRPTQKACDTMKTKELSKQVRGKVVEKYRSGLAY